MKVLVLCGVRWSDGCPALQGGVHVCGCDRKHGGRHQCVACLALGDQ